jgi:hypothetical protein
MPDVRPVLGAGVARNPPAVSLSCSWQPARVLPRTGRSGRVFCDTVRGPAPLQQFADGVAGAPGVWICRVGTATITVDLVQEVSGELGVSLPLFS